LPSLRKLRCRRKVAGIAFPSALREPLLNDGDLGVSQRMLSDEAAVLRLGAPRRHDAALRERRDLTDMLSGGGISEQAERCRALWTMAGGASREQQRSDVFVEGDRLPGVKGNTPEEHK